MTPTTKRILEWIVGIICVAVIAAIVMPVSGGHGRGAPATACLSNMKQIGLAAIMYAADNDERFPPAQTWEDAVLPTYAKQTSFACPLAPGHRYGYAMNRAISLANSAKFQRPEEQITFFESVACVRNANGTERLMPRPGRHSGRNTVAYADGHAKSIEPPL